MNNTLLQINNLTASADEKTILKNLNLQINSGEIHVLMGPNGAGKSTLGNVIMGNPQYSINEGTILFENENITDISTDKRAKKGLFLSFQSPIEIAGISISQFLRTTIDSKETKKMRIKVYKDKLNQMIDTLNINPLWINRELNVGFSGGERKKIEMLQLLMLEPKLAILDETDSGLDVDAVKTVSKGINTFIKDTNRSLLIITHNSKLLEHLKVDFVHIIVNGTIVKTSDASLVKTINEQGYEAFL